MLKVQIQSETRGLMDTKSDRRTPFLWVAILTLGVASVVFYSFHTGRSMVERYVPLIGAAVDIKYQATSAHLWFEEIISGDPFVDIRDVWKYLDKAEWYALAMLEGGEANGNSYVPLKELALREGIEQTLEGIRAFRVIAQERWRLRSVSGVGSDIDQRFDKTFDDFLLNADDVLVALRLMVKQQLRRFHFMQGLLVAITGILGVLIGVVLQRHERRRTRDMLILQDREENLRITLNSIGDGVIATDAEGNVTRMNPVAEQLTGWSLAEAEGQPLKTIFPIINVTTREPMENPVEKVIATGKTVFLSNHTTLISKHGAEYQIADSAAPIRADEKILGMVLVFNDVTEQYHLREAATKSKRDLQAIMDHSPAVIYVKDIEGRFIFINQQFEKLFHTKREDILNKTLHDIFPKDVADQMQSNDKAVLAAGHAIESEERAPQDDGIHTYVSIKFPLFNEENNIYAVCGISTDITERRHQEEQLRRSQKMEALGKLTGGIAHDYNNLLGIIMGYAEQLNDRLTDEPTLGKYAQSIQRAAERGAKLTQKLLAFTRHKSLDATVLNINELIQEQRLMLEKTLTVRIKLVLDLADNLWPVLLDNGDLEDAIINMSINAMHAISGNGQLTLRTHNQKLTTLDAQRLNLDVGDYILLSITDTGSGMDIDTKEKIFDPFFSTKGERGTGLGLSQVYGFVERSSGVIKVYSEAGQGSCFVLYFPRSRHTGTHSPTPPCAETQHMRGSETLLIVDDEPALVELAQDILSTQGYRILTAHDGAQALRILEKADCENAPIDLIISDLIMPHMDGYQLAAHVQQHYPRIKLQMVSGFADDRPSALGDDALHQNLLYKPYSSRTLLAQVRNRLDEPTNPADAQAPSDTRASQNTLAGCTILVMDDEADVRELFSLRLAKLGCQTLLASTGEQALGHYQEALDSGNRIDIVILDLSLPGEQGGRAVAALIRRLDPQAKIIVASGYSGGPEMTRYKDHGFDGALEKNFDQETIKQLLEKVLQIS